MEENQVLIQLMYSSFTCILLFHELVVAEQNTDRVFTRYRKAYLAYSASPVTVTLYPNRVSASDSQRTQDLIPENMVFSIFAQKTQQPAQILASNLKNRYKLFLLDKQP